MTRVLLDAARKMNAASGADAFFHLAFLSDNERCPKPEDIAQRLPPGAAFIYRDYALPNREVLGRRLRDICLSSGAYFVVGGDPALARVLNADGLHLRGTDLDDRPREKNWAVITAACHSGEELEKAAAIGANLAFLSPVFRTQSHRHARPLGIEKFRSLAASSPIPVLALGGVDASNAMQIIGANVAGFGAIGAFSAPPAST